MENEKLKKIEKLDLEFCTECGKSLDDFDIVGIDNSFEALLKQFEQCRKNGRFKGDICSKLFIANQTFDSTEDLSN
ncbi:MAG: hypothetical protein PVH88_17465 [Ignavibacteria bacterium]|jgi:hypothetical protein